MEAEKILILGSDGQIGKPLSRILGERFEVRGIDLNFGPEDDLRREEVLAGKLLRQLRWCDLCIFLAFDVGGAKYLSASQNRFDFIHNNVSIMENVFAALSITGKPFLFASSQLALTRESTYGRLKMVGEAYTESLDGISLRMWNVFGCEEESQKSHVVSDFIHMAKEGVIRMRTDGTEVRQMLHVEDYAGAILALIENFEELVMARVVNVSSFQNVTVMDIAEAVQKVVNPDCKIIKGNPADDLQCRLDLFPDDSKLLYYWKPKLTLEEGVRKVAEEIG